MSVIKSDEISISEYLKRFEQNVSQSWTQKLQPVSFITSNWTFNFSSPGYDTLMGAQVFLYARIKLVKNDAFSAQNVLNATPSVIRKREGYPLMKAMRSCALTLNGQSISFKPDDFIDELTYLTVGKSQSGKVCEPLLEAYEPVILLANQTGGNKTNQPDLGVQVVQNAANSRNVDGAFSSYLTGSYAKRFRDFTNLPLNNPATSKTVDFFEPVFMPIMNFFGDVAYDSLPS